jgi:hypothetical protein
MKIMANHSSAREREGIPHVTTSTKNVTSSAKKKALNLNGTAKSTKRKALNLNGTARSTKRRTPNLNDTAKTTISSALRRRALSVIKDRSIDAQSRALIRYALETNDPWLAELVRRADAGETIIYTVNSLKRPHPAKR